MEEKQLTAAQKFRQYFSKNIGMTIIFILGTIIVFSLGVISTESLYFSIPLFLVPLLFAYQVICTDVETGLGFTNRGIISSFQKYFFGPHRGCYRVIRAFLLSMLISIAVSAAFCLAYISIAYASSTEFRDAFELLKLVSEEDVVENGLNFYLTKYEPIAVLFIWTQLFEGFVFTLSFTHSILWHSPLAILQGSPLIIDRRAFLTLFKGALRKDKKGYISKYCKSAWPSYFLLITGYIIGSLVSFAIMSETGYIVPEYADHYLVAAVASLFIGVATGVVAMSFSLPYFFYCIEDLTFSLMPKIREYSLEIAKENLNRLKRFQQISEEEAKLYEQEINLAEKEMEEMDSDDSDKTL